MILLWGIERDEPIAAVKRALIRRGAPVFFVEQQHVLETRVDLEVNGHVTGLLQVGTATVHLESVTACYLRPYDSGRMRAVERSANGSEQRQHALQVDEALVAWGETTPARVINRPSRMASNNSKPYQMALIRQAGFAVPETLVTTDPQAVREFRERHGMVIYKSLSGIRSIVAQVNSEHHARLPDVANCPTQFQQYLPGIDYRVHVVGRTAFACEIASNDVDYRYSRSGKLQMRPCQIPADVRDRCVALSAALDLAVSGVDLRRTPAGEWYCFEANPSPGFTFFEQATGLPIAGAIADLLMGDSRN